MSAPLTPLETSRREADARREIATLEAELRALDAPGGPRGSLAKELVLVPATPCGEPWRAMIGDDRVRRCSRCARDVLDLSGLRHDEITTLLTERGLPRCERFYRREDGTLSATDCPISRPRHLALRALAVIGVAVLLATLTALFVSHLAPVQDLAEVPSLPAE